MKYRPDLIKISKAYYNRGLERAKLNDLSGAAVYLKKSLIYDKYRTEARNLLGLIFYESGETADAIVQWVVSINLDPRDNDADRYLDEIQRKPGVLSEASALVRRFNQALEIAQNGGEDFAMVELSDITRKKPNYIKAQLLLAILYMQAGEHIKAGKALMAVLDIDRNHPQATILMDEVKRATGKAEVERAKLKNAYSHRELEEGDVIIPKTRAGTSLDKVVIYITAGIIIGLVSFYLLILPSVRRIYNRALNDSIIQNSAELSDVNARYSELSDSYDELNVEFQDVSQRLNAYEEQNINFTSAYESLNSIISDCGAGNYEAAADKYLQLDRSIITSEPLISQLQEADRLMLNDGFTAISEMGTAQWNGGNLSAAENYYRLALNIKPDDPEVMFLLARLLQSQDRISEANEIFDKIVGEHPESPYAQRSIDARGY
jgi:tetratricopeptide (TPR) repeat protein